MKSSRWTNGVPRRGDHRKKSRLATAEEPCGSRNRSSMQIQTEARGSTGCNDKLAATIASSNPRGFGPIQPIELPAIEGSSDGNPAPDAKRLR